MIVDTFLFYNEFDLLDIRLRELDDVVDHFHLVESPQTFTGKPKPLYFWDNKERFRDFWSKMSVGTAPATPELTNPWDVEFFQRDWIGNGLRHFSPSDLILLSDVDEIPNPDVIARLPAHEPRVLIQSLHFYYLNYRSPQPWHGTLSAPKDLFDCFSPQELRNQRWDFGRVYDGGWHFTWFGGVEKCLEKLAVTAHQELNKSHIANTEYVAERMARGEALSRQSFFTCVRVPINPYFPRTIVNNIEQYKRWIRE